MFFSNIFHLVVAQTLISTHFFNINVAITARIIFLYNDVVFAGDLLFLQ